MVETPTEKFVIVDKLGVVKATLDLIASGLDPQDALTGFPAEQKADAAERILEMLRQRKLIIAGNRSEKTVIDPIYPWLRHIAAADKASLHCAVVGDGLLASIVTEELSEIGMKPFRCHANLDLRAAADMNFAVVCLDHPNEALLRKLNRIAVKRNIALLYVSLDRHIASIGPLVLPRATACYECYYHRVRSSRKTMEIENVTLSSSQPSRVVARLAAAQAVATILRFISGASFDLHLTSVLRHNLLDGRSGYSTILKIPRCSVCGSANLTKPLMPSYASISREVEEQAA